MTIGPKDKCPCGSGRKYKKCCMPGSEHHDEQMHEAKYDLIRQCEQRVMTKLISFADKEGLWAEDPEELVELFGERCRPLVETEAFLDDFLPSWWLFQPFPSDDEGAAWQSYAQDFLAERENRLREDDRTFLRAVLEAPYGVYYIEDVDPEHGLSVRDIGSNIRCEVTEHTASKTLRPGDIVYTRVARMYGVHFFFGMAPSVLPPEYYTEVEDIARETEEALADKFKHVTNFPPHLLRGEVVRRSFFLLVGEMLLGGDELGMGVNLRFELCCSAEDAYQALVPLAEGQLDEGDDGREINDPELFVLPWYRLEGGKPQIHGILSLKGENLTAEVAPGEVDELRARIEKLLGERVRFTGREEKPMQDALQDMLQQAGKLVRIGEGAEEHERLMQSPEVREKLKQMADDHWEKWYQTAIPALNGETPLQAAKSPEGRNRLEALFAIYEANAEKVNEDFLRPDIEALRRRLGMERGQLQ